MQIEKVDVKVDKEVIGVAEVPVFESLDEAISHFTKGDEQGADVVLRLLNAKVRQNETSKVRIDFTQSTPERVIARVARQHAAGEISTEEMTKKISEAIERAKANAEREAAGENDAE